MELDYNLYALFETVGFVQALTLGILLIVLNKKKYKSTLFLGLFLVFFALETIPIILESLNAYKHYPELYLLPFDFFWFHFPLFYLYTQHVCIYSDHKLKFWVLYPGIVAFYLQLAVFFMPYESKIDIVQGTGYNIYYAAKVVYGLGIGIYTLGLIYRHKKEVHNSFSMVENKELTWARIFLIYNITGSILYTIVANTLAESSIAEVFFVIFDLVLIYWVSYHGIEQRNVLSLLAKKGSYGIVENKPPDSVNTPTMTHGKMEELMEQINAYMSSYESYMQTELTIIDLAEQLKVHPKRISTTINKIQNQNFNTYVNKFRVKKAEELLKSDEIDTLSIEGIGNKVGFHSKSAFYAAFKKQTGTTPRKYMEDLAA